MKRRFLPVLGMGSALILTLWVCALSTAAGQQRHRNPEAQHGFGDINVWAPRLEDPQRDHWQKPDEVVRYLNLNPGDVIADIGAGTGYFTRRFAAIVEPHGAALGLEVESSMVNYMKKDAQRLSLKSYKPRLVKPDDPGLEPRSVDVIFLCNAYHHIDNRVSYFKRLAKNLKSNGRLVIVDFYDKPLPVGPVHKLSERTVIQELGQAGYRLKRSLEFLPYQYFLEFGL